MFDPLFCYALSALRFEIVSLRKWELSALFKLSSCCLVAVGV